VDDVRTLPVTTVETRCDRWLAGVLGWSRSRVKELFDAGRVQTSEGVPLRARDALEPGASVTVRIPEAPVPQALLQEDIDVPLVFQDEHVLVVDKPADLVVHPARGHQTGTLVNALLDLVEEGLDAERPGIVHRLDKGTSGLLVVARTRQAQSNLQAQFEQHSVDRRYLALVWGIPRDLSGTIDAPLARHAKDRMRFAVSDNGRRAVTHWKRLAVGKAISLVECRLETGRTHQVRVHLHHLGHGVVGDPLYRPRGTPGSAPLVDHQLLHAFRLGFDHPATGERVTFETPPPADFLATLASLAIPWPLEVGKKR
jgi:23S rRNA pseudouridine1911/1915/1917 synthase